MRGFQAAIEHEFAFRLEIFLSAFLIPLALFLGPTPSEKTLLLISWLIVPLAELINSAIETTIDRIGLEHDVLSGRAKDLGSACVFMACTLWCCTWLIIIYGLITSPR